MSAENPIGKFVINGQEIEVYLKDIESKPQPGKYTLPDGKVIIVEDESSKPGEQLP